VLISVGVGHILVTLPAGLIEKNVIYIPIPVMLLNTGKNKCDEILFYNKVVTYND
jgi:hypothetical protein